LQNGFILPSQRPEDTPRVFQNQPHMDFKRILNGCMASVNTLLTVSEFTRKNGGAVVVPGSHQCMEASEAEYAERVLEYVECPLGSTIVFDSTLWHAPGQNTS